MIWWSHSVPRQVTLRWLVNCICLWTWGLFTWSWEPQVGEVTRPPVHIIWSRWHDRWGPPPPCKQALKQLAFKLISILFSPSVNSILQCKTTYLLQKEPLVGSQNRRSLNHECQATNIYNIAMHAVYMYGVDWLKTVLSFLSSKCSLFYNTHSGRALSTLSG